MFIWFMKERLVNKLFSSLRTFGFLFGYLPVSLLKYKKIKEQKNILSTEQYDLLVHNVPKLWASGILKRTKSQFTLEGEEYLPSGPVLFIANHEGNFDIPSLLAYIPKPFGFISKIEVKKLPIISKWMEEMNCVFIDRSNRKSAYKSIEDTATHLQNGHSILIFPEGTRSKGKEIGIFKSGFVRIAKQARVPIVPIAIYGTSKIMEKNNNKICPANVQISILPTYTIESIDQNDTKKIIEDLHTSIARKIEMIRTTSK
ncbi:lysophospholipid acyltransferase family protein [Psychrobacillus sp. FSL K6-1415]|uniref:lysophospholipid acyltransferase family protein n=1 Tax=Psychrobacillus sp. FSL K6-1415 TaxID=2921544 RepID=UPI0030FB040E